MSARARATSTSGTCKQNQCALLFLEKLLSSDPPNDYSSSGPKARGATRRSSTWSSTTRARAFPPTPFLALPLTLKAPTSAIVINSNDRCIRVIRLLASAPSDSDPDEPSSSPPPPPRPPRVPWFDVQHRFQDLVNRTPWNGCGFSRDGEYIIGGSSRSTHGPVARVCESCY